MMCFKTFVGAEKWQKVWKILECNPVTKIGRIGRICKPQNP